ncbi:MAG: alanine racemase [Mycobacterium leprae]
MDLTRIRPTWVEVDLDAIVHNITALRHLVPGAQFMAVVKADGYGHGALPTARVALQAGAAWLGVATVEEAVQLREAGVTAPILMLGFVSPSQAETVVRYGLRTTLFHLDLAEALSQVGETLGRKVPVHLKIDTGMSRIGIRPSEAVSFVRALQELPAIEVEGIFTHLATADEPDNDFADQQLALFKGVLAHLAEIGVNPPVRHALNSAGIMLHPEGQFDLVRGGAAMYGIEPDPAVQWPVPLEPALTWRTRVVHVKTVEPGTPISYGCTYRAADVEKIATLPLGYADGYSRFLSNRGEVLIRGRRCPVVGRVCMDQTMVRIPDDLDVLVGDEVVLMGEQQGEWITAGDMARTIGTINYEVLCAISKRVPRLYRQHGQLQL